MQKKVKILFLTVLTIIISPLMSNSQDVREAMTLYFSEVRHGKFPPVPKTLSLSENSKNTLEAITPYLTDTLQDVRAKALSLVNLAGNNARQGSMRELAVQKLIMGIKDKSSGNAGSSLEYLSNFLQDDFNAIAKDSIRKLFKQKTLHYDKLIKIIGFLDLKDLAETIRPLSSQGNPHQLRWAALLALTRLQDATARQELMNRVRKLPVNDDVVYEIFPDLIYTRDREAINYMVELIHSDGKFCISPDAEREIPIPCGYRIMEQLAPVIKDYPLQIDESGDLKTEDYLAALASVRYWFTKHKDYSILTDKY